MSTEMFFCEASVYPSVGKKKLNVQSLGELGLIQAVNGLASMYPCACEWLYTYCAALRV
jgi:hypothetical protein